MQEIMTYGGWPHCVRLSNGRIELVVTTDVGPRIIRCGYVGGRNLFCEFEEQLGKSGGDEWRSYGGHRFWHAPEAIPRTYWPDNTPVAHAWDGRVLRLTQDVEATTGLAKELEIMLEAERDRVTVRHRLINRGLFAVEAAPWALSVMARGGRAIFPQEPFQPHAERLLPARPLVLWAYTNMADPRWTWGEKYIQLQQDPSAQTLQKVGMLNSLGWAAYALGADVFLKRYAADLEARYPDFGCNTEAFTNADMLEVETLGPLARLEPGGSVEHVEQWYLYRAELGTSEGDLDETLRPLVDQSPFVPN